VPEKGVMSCVMTGVGLLGIVTFIISQSILSKIFAFNIWAMDWKNSLTNTPYFVIFLFLAILSVSLLTNVSSMPEPLDFTVSLSSNSESVNIGDQTSIDVTITKVSGRGDVSLSATGVPSGVSISFNPSVVKLSKTQTSFISTMEIITSQTTVNGSYSIQVMANGKNIEKSQTFVLTITGTPLPPSGDIVIGVAGDIACKPPKGKGNGGKETEKACAQRRTSDLLIAMNPTAVLTLGDNQYEAGKFDEFRKSYDPTWGILKSITYPSVGNHEYHTSGASGYYQYFGDSAGDPTKGYYSFDIGSWHIVSLNSNCSEVGGCGTNSPQAIWLDNDLKTHNNACTLAYWHHPTFSAGSHGDNSKMDYFWQLLDANNVDVALAGHDHNYQRFAPMDLTGSYDPDGVREFVVGTGGKSHYSLDPNAHSTLEVYNTSTFGVLKMTLHDTSYDWEFVPEEGKSFTDTGSELCN